jgi:hypothetical protein
VVQCLVEELGAVGNLATTNGGTPLIAAAGIMHHKVVRYLIKHDANTQASHNGPGATAATISRIQEAPAEQTAYLEARTHCANPGCTNAGRKKCERCLQTYSCGSPCIRAHWPAHKAECKAAAAKLKAARGYDHRHHRPQCPRHHNYDPSHHENDLYLYCFCHHPGHNNVIKNFVGLCIYKSTIKCRCAAA